MNRSHCAPKHPVDGDHLYLGHVHLPAGEVLLVVGPGKGGLERSCHVVGGAQQPKIFAQYLTSVLMFYFSSSDLTKLN